MKKTDKRIQPKCRGCGLTIMVTWPKTQEGREEMNEVLHKIGWMGRMCPECWWKLSDSFLKGGRA